MELKKIIKGCIDGDPKSQRALYDLSSDKVMSTCRRYVSNEDDALDLFQDAYIKIFKYIHSYQEEQGELLGWIYQIAKNVAFSHLQSKKIKFVEISAEAEEQGVYFEGLAELQNQEVVKQIQLLPEGYRAVLNLAIFEELSHAEIAKILNITESTSRSQLTRARAMLKNKLENLYSSKYEKIIL